MSTEEVQGPIATDEGAEVSGPPGFSIRLSSPIAIELQVTDTSRTLFWFADRGFLGRTESAESRAWAPTQAGRYTVRVLDEADARTCVT